MADPRVHTNIKAVVLEVFKKYDGKQVNLDSQAAKEMIAEDISEEVTDWVRNLWKEDF